MTNDHSHDLNLAGREAKGAGENDPWVMPLGILTLGVVVSVLLLG
jgi:hypothetical protein